MKTVKPVLINYDILAQKAPTSPPRPTPSQRPATVKSVKVIDDAFIPHAAFIFLHRKQPIERTSSYMTQGCLLISLLNFIFYLYV